MDLPFTAGFVTRKIQKPFGEDTMSRGARSVTLAGVKRRAGRGPPQPAVLFGRTRTSGKRASQDARVP